jgi:hypothetical protein
MIREYGIGRDGVWIGPPLVGFRGVMTGVPSPSHLEEDLEGEVFR